MSTVLRISLIDIDIFIILTLPFVSAWNFDLKLYYCSFFSHRNVNNFWVYLSLNFHTFIYIRTLCTEICIQFFQFSNRMLIYAKVVKLTVSVYFWNWLILYRWKGKLTLMLFDSWFFEFFFNKNLKWFSNIINFLFNPTLYE